MNAVLSMAATRLVHEPSKLVLGQCRLCGCQLNAGEGDNLTNEICSACEDRPEAKRLSHKRPAAGAGAAPARDITPAEKALIRKLHGFMPAQQLLGILNERLYCDLGPDAAPYTMEQLYAEIGEGAVTAPAGGIQDWAGMRKLLNQAKKSGVLAAINEQVINDFAVVYSLNQKQILGLKDILLHETEEK
ncbi:MULTISPECIES: hypothetical protein [Polaromonas]|uniref:Uncharacterized protein n=1 Tax=Polaromonas aquatica TaxID=332657 RepID=A0ABW1TX07_9BURK